MAQLLLPGLFSVGITGRKMYENYKDKSEKTNNRKTALRDRQDSMCSDTPSSDHLKKRGYMLTESMIATGKLGQVSEAYLEKNLKTNSALAGYKDHIRSKFSESRPRLDSAISSSSLSTSGGNTPAANPVV